VRTYTTGLDLQLVDRRSAIPIGSAVVNIAWDSNRLTTEHADVHGRVSVELPEGAYDVMVAADGYNAALFRGIGVLEGQRVELIRALSVGNGRLEEKPSGAIGGTCVDRLEQPISNIIVQATSGALNYTVRTDKHGCYMLNGVEPGTYSVTFRTGDRAVLSQQLTIARPRQLIRYDARLLFV
jgi:hypothetical protein